MNDFASWVGREEQCQDVISSTLVRRVAVTFGDATPGDGEPLPHLWHWAFFQEPVVEELLGADGHPARGIFLPPIDGRNRMWAGGRVSFHRPLLIGMEAKRNSTISSVKEKHGKTGKLLFVTVSHRYTQDGQTCISEEQDIVYREPSPPRLESSEKVPELEWSDEMNPSPVTLFRYSAVTFNGHRIHYDYPYVTSEEGYPGLVVHGPMIATLMLRSFIKSHPDKNPSVYSYRGLRPLIAGSRFEVGGVKDGDNIYRLLAYNAQGPAHQSQVEYKENV